MPKACIYAVFRYLLYQMHLVDDNIPLEGVFHGYDELDNERIHLDFCWLSLEDLKKDMDNIKIYMSSVY